MAVPTPVVDPWIALAAIAATTERIRFGPMVTPLPRRRPWKLAHPRPCQRTLICFTF
jgi:alkanesulfonate monooxygenase SsuD/methylene tetrahydromethanopterin reductase-like flavin-dependent oxidoreductase (luciferase family)